MQMLLDASACAEAGLPQLSVGLDELSSVVLPSDTQRTLYEMTALLKMETQLSVACSTPRHVYQTAVTTVVWLLKLTRALLMKLVGYEGGILGGNGGNTIGDSNSSRGCGDGCGDGEMPHSFAASSMINRRGLLNRYYSYCGNPDACFLDRVAEGCNAAQTTNDAGAAASPALALSCLGRFFEFRREFSNRSKYTLSARACLDELLAASAASAASVASVGDTAQGKPSKTDT